ncbi:MAG: prephenate dehydratase domain-containing protein, partial [Pseudomonadota bacterium]
MAQSKIAYQGERGANSHIACREMYPDHEPIACGTFEDVIAMVESGDAALAMIPVENTIAGRVGDIHHLLPETSLHMIGEHLMRIRFQLMGLKGSNMAQIKSAYSHV